LLGISLAGGEKSLQLQVLSFNDDERKKLGADIVFKGLLDRYADR
jgi:hypothetical protein